MKIRVCLDIRVCQKSSRYTGTGIYAFQLSRNLFELESETDFEFWFLGLKGYELPWDIPFHRLLTVSRLQKPQSLQEVFDVFDLEKLLRRNKISLFHSLVPGLLKPKMGLPVIVTVHDIIPEIIKGENYKSSFTRLIYKIKMRCAISATQIFVNSNATKNDLIRRYNLNEHKITNIYFGSQTENSVKESNVRFSKKRSRKYILYLGGFNYRKNVSSLINAFNLIADDFPEVDLLLVGKPTLNQMAELKKISKNLGLNTERIIWQGFVPDMLLSELYMNSEMFVYPSLYEGFGLPVLEAMQNGAALITSNRGSLPEIVEDAGLIVNPESISEIADSIKMILMDIELKNTLKAKGFIQGMKFSWKKCAIESINGYRSVLNQNK
jgi:glycosyltransferase involved in cell wall biosynthesis